MSKPWFRYVGLVDVADGPLAEAQRLAGLPDSAVFHDLGPALADLKPDTVIVNTPSEWHFAQTRACLDAGCHVLVAKPFTNDYEQAVELVQLARARALTLGVGHQIRYNRHYAAVAQFVKSGGVGEPCMAWLMNSKPRPDPANLAKLAQPALYEMTCHHLDSLSAVFEGRVPEWVQCDGFSPPWSRYAGPSMVNALIGFSGGLHVCYHGGFAAQAPMYEFRIEGTKGALRCRGLHMSNDTMEYDFAPALGDFAPLRSDEVGGGPAPCDPFIPFLDSWYEYRCGGPEPPFSGRNNLRVFAALSAMIEAVEAGGRVAVADNPRFAYAFA